MAKRTPEGPAPAPPVQKLRVRYAKRGRLRFSSTRDFQRALERALRRSGVPTAFSAGFHPHPKVSYANAAPTGAASEAEYFELSVTERVDPERVREALDGALPEGLDVLEVVEAGEHSLADRLQASAWVLDLPGLEVDELSDALRRLLERDEVEVTRVTKRGPRTFDVRSAIVTAGATSGPLGARLDLVLRHAAPSVRPDDVMTALRECAGLLPPRSPRATRLMQGTLGEDGTIGDPLAGG